MPCSWSELSWQQLCDCWRVKQRYGGNADVARAAALLTLCGLKVVRRGAKKCSRSDNIITHNRDDKTGERFFLLKDKAGRLWEATPREISGIAKKALAWFDFPYGDKGEDPVKDDNGKVVKEGREAHAGYVGPMRDAMLVPVDTVKIGRRRFAMPQVACNNLTWQQYRSLQVITPELFAEDTPTDAVVEAEAKFLANILAPRSVALLDMSGGSIRIRPHYEYRYNAEQTEGLTPFFIRRITRERHRKSGDRRCEASTLFHICFQAYQTALSYYSSAYPLLFHGGDKSDPLKDALTGEVGTVNTVMKYAGYAEQQQVYDSNVPFVLDILNTMTKEAKEIEKINNRVKRKK